MRSARLASVPAVLALAVAGLTATTAHADQASGSTIYVNNFTTGCSNTAPGAGSAAVPFCTVQAAADVVRAGQTIQLFPSSTPYQGPVVLKNSGTSAAPITIDGDATLGSTTQGAALTLDGVDYVTVDNLRINAASGQDAVDVDGSQNITLNHLILSESATITGVPARSGVTVDGASSDVTLSRSTFLSAWGTSAVHAEAGSQRVVITTNEITTGGTTAHGRVWLDGAVNAAVTSNALGSGAVPAVTVDGGSSAAIENNVMGASTGPAISVAADSDATVRSDYNTVIPTTAGVPLYSWAGASYTTPAELTAWTGQGAHDGVTVASETDSADSGATGELSTDWSGNPRAQDPDVPDTGAGPFSYYDRGVTEREDVLAFSQPGNLVTTAGTAVDEQPVSAPTSAWGEALTMTVDFGDGSPAQSAPVGTAIPHTYTAPGAYATTLTVTNADGMASARTRDVDVLTATVDRPVLTAATLRNSNGAPESGSDQFSLSGAAVGGWQYSSAQITFGDGTSAAWNAADPVNNVHGYRSGVYDATVTTTDLLGRTATGSTTVVVGEDLLPQSPATRLYDSRPQGYDSVPAHSTVRVLTEYSVDSLVLNVTVTHTKAAGFVTVFPDGVSRPDTSTLNFEAGDTVANQATVRLSPHSAYFDVYNGSSGPIDLVIDIAGYNGMFNAYQPGVEYHPVTPTRILDTRGTHKQVPANGSVTVAVPSTLVPAPGGDTMEVNVTATDEHSSGFATVYTTGQTLPPTSNLNWAPWTDTSNLVTVVADGIGRITIHNSGPAATDFVVDLVGYYRTATADDSLTGFVSLPTPQRLLDTRGGSGVPSTPLRYGQQVKVCVPGPADSVAAALNLTVTGSTGKGWLTAYPDGTTRPGTSNVNWSAGQTVANMTLTRTGSDGCVEIYDGGATVSVIADLSGYQAAEK
ncbi:PKD domain-containing protein [Streptacidiphilus sp. P02-A3a]|uniref:PKD domain-containing protein n=1 Tax=Streptacidiphilus sp. P02-A3a TaxID=2704468 RepID=UPI0015FAFB3B|nr:PKD domain-containing protein [Streptacidiphilus sp. P02-A3a]QMU73360.1 PKD domain-containing protein [Streptacidiphilus sp. P02-A3a]